jgi:class 3 adenylate cyclase/tetratricopeptide (TPR) repeat protein
MDLQERLDPEVWAQIMGRFVSILAEGVRKFGGTVDKFTGDGIMALFGAPVAQEDHARRACHAAWHLTKAIGEWSEELRREHGIDLQVRLGLNSGEVVVGRVGDDVTLDPTALGHTVGLAQRMEALAEPGTVYLTEYTARLVEGWFRLDDLGGRRVKGAADPLRVCALGTPMPSPVRRTVGAAALVGRERELAVLEDALEMACDAQFQVVGVVGEAGVGKSRLCDEFARSALARGLTVRRASGVSHARDVPLLPILTFHRDYFGISESDDAASARGKVAGRLLGLDPDLEGALPVLFDFLEVPDPDHPAGPMSAEVRMGRIFDVVRRITARRTERETLVLIFEDLHWFDSQSEAFLHRLIESYPGSRTVVVANFRPEFSAPWMRHSYYRQLPLAPLRQPAVSELLGQLLGVDLSLAPLVPFVQERTGGNPFFVEEVVRALVEDGTLSGDSGSCRLTRPIDEIRVPPSVQAVLAARIDRLPTDEKQLLQTAAVLGRAFATAVLADVTGLAPQVLEDSLSALCAAELLQKAANNPVVEYRFWHPLTQEVAYGALLGERRRSLHAAAARSIASRHRELLDEQAALIAGHWAQAGEMLEAGRWNIRAGAWALRADVGEAIRRWRAALDHLAAAGGVPEAADLEISARSLLMRYGVRAGMGSAELQRIYRDGRALADRFGDPGALASMTWAYAVVRMNQGGPAEALELFREARLLADPTRRPEAQLAARLGVALLVSFTGPVEEGLGAVDEVKSLTHDDPDFGFEHITYSPLVLALRSQSELLALSGHLAEGRALADDVLTLARERCEPENLCWMLATYPRLVATVDQALEAVTNAREAFEVVAHSGNLAMQAVALSGLGAALVEVEDFSQATQALRRGLAIIREAGVGRWEEGRMLIALCRAMAGAGDLDAALAVADEAVELAHRQGARIIEGHALLVRATFAQQRRRQPNLILADLAAASVLARETGAVRYEPFIHEALGRLHDDDNELGEALRLYRRVGATGHARRLEAELSTRATR